jgi:hypothetical protein
MSNGFITPVAKRFGVFKSPTARLLSRTKSTANSFLPWSVQPVTSLSQMTTYKVVLLVKGQPKNSVEWQQTNGRYTLQWDTCEVSVWQRRDKRWIARVSSPYQAAAMRDFATREAAQAWSIAELAKLHQAGDCDEAA